MLVIAIVIVVVVVIALGAFALIARRRSNRERAAPVQGHRQTNPVYAEPGDPSAGDQSRPAVLNTRGYEQPVTLNPQYVTRSRVEGASHMFDSELYVAFTQTPGSTRPSSERDPRSASIALDSQQYVAAPERGEENAEGASTAMLDSERYVASAHRDLGISTQGESGAYEYTELGERHPDFSI